MSRDRVEPLHRHPNVSRSVSRTEAFTEGVHYRVTDSDCWEWQRRFDGKGYGIGGAVAGERRAHRASWALANGPIPEGSHIHHRCENPPCINPAHLECHSHSAHLILHKQADSSLSWDDVRAIRSALLEGTATQQEIRVRYGIAQPTLSDIATNTTWVDPEYEPGYVRECLRPDCRSEFWTTKSTHKFCSQGCRTRHNQRLAWGYYERRGIAA